ncbi:MAG TPA: flagellar hook-length control protein FliK [Sphingomonas sp.]
MLQLSLSTSLPSPTTSGAGAISAPSGDFTVALADLIGQGGASNQAGTAGTPSDDDRQDAADDGKSLPASDGDTDSARIDPAFAWLALGITPPVDAVAAQADGGQATGSMAPALAIAAAGAGATAPSPQPVQPGSSDDGATPGGTLVTAPGAAGTAPVPVPADAVAQQGGATAVMSPTAPQPGASGTASPLLDDQGSAIVTPANSAPAAASAGQAGVSGAPSTPADGQPLPIAKAGSRSSPMATLPIASLANTTADPKQATAAAQVAGAIPDQGAARPPASIIAGNGNPIAANGTQAVTAASAVSGQSSISAATSLAAAPQQTVAPGQTMAGAMGSATATDSAAPVQASSQPAAPAAPTPPPPPPISTGAQPAAIVFGAAIASAFAQDQRSAVSDRPSPQDQALQVLASAVGSTHSLGAVPAAASAQQSALDMRRDDWPQAMIDRIEALRDAANANDTRIRLVPDALGKVDVSIRHDGDAVHVQFNAEVPATRTLIAEAQPKLAEIAQARGIKLHQTSVDAGDAGSGQHRRGAAPQSSQSIRPASAFAAEIDSAESLRLA